MPFRSSFEVCQLSAGAPEHKTNVGSLASQWCNLRCVEVYVLLLVLFGVNAVIFQSSHLRVCGSSAVGP